LQLTYTFVHFFFAIFIYTVELEILLKRKVLILDVTSILWHISLN